MHSIPTFLNQAPITIALDLLRGVNASFMLGELALHGPIAPFVARRQVGVLEGTPVLQMGSCLGEVFSCVLLRVVAPKPLALQHEPVGRLL